MFCVVQSQQSRFCGVGSATTSILATMDYIQRLGAHASVRLGPYNFRQQFGTVRFCRHFHTRLLSPGTWLQRWQIERARHTKQVHRTSFRKRAKRSSPEWSVNVCPVLCDGCERVAYPFTICASASAVATYVPKHLPKLLPLNTEGHAIQQ